MAYLVIAEEEITAGLEPLASDRITLVLSALLIDSSFAAFPHLHPLKDAGPGFDECRVEVDCA